MHSVGWLYFLSFIMLQLALRYSLNPVRARGAELSLSSRSEKPPIFDLQRLQYFAQDLMALRYGGPELALSKFYVFTGRDEFLGFWNVRHVERDDYIRHLQLKSYQSQKDHNICRCIRPWRTRGIG